MNAIKDNAFAGLNDALLRSQVMHFMLGISRTHRCGTHAMAKLLLISVLLISYSSIANGQSWSFFPSGADPSAFEPENLWWGANHQKYVREIQAGCRAPGGTAYEEITQSIHDKIRVDAGYEVKQEYASIIGALNAKSVSDLPTPSDFDSFFERVCRVIASDVTFHRPEEYCFANEQDVAAFEWKDGISKYKQAEHNRTLIASLRPRMRNNCEHWMKNSGYLSGAYAASMAYEAEQATITAKRAEEEQRREQEAKRTRERNAELARQQRNALKERVAVEMKLSFEEAAVAERDQIIWEHSGSRRSAAIGKRFPDSNTLFNELNAELERHYVQISRDVPFVPPVKAEFETTSAYKERVDVLRVEHAKEVSTQRSLALEQWTSTRAKIFHEYLGEPAIEKLTYNADKEIFSVRIKTGSAPYYVDAVVNVPLASAPAVKSELEGASIKLGFALTNDVLEPKVLLLHTSRDLWVASISSSTQVSMRFGAESASAWATAQAAKVELAGRERANAHAGPRIRYEHDISGALTVGDSPRAILAKIWSKFTSNPRNTNANSRQINVRGTLIKEGTVPAAALNSSAPGRLPSYLACYQYVQVFTGLGDQETELCIYYTDNPSRGTHAIGWRGPEYIRELEAQMVADEFRSN